MAKIVRLVIPKWAICHNVSASHTEVCPFLACPQVSLVFRGNRAIFAPVMYISSLDACSWFNNSGLYFNTNITETWSFMSAEWVTLSFTLFSYSQSPSHSLSLQLFSFFPLHSFFHIFLSSHSYFLFSSTLTLPTLPRQNYILGSESPTYSPADPQLYIQTDVNDLRIDIPLQCQGKNNTDDNMEVVSTDSSTCDAYEDRLCELHWPLQCISLTFVLLQCAYPGQDIQLKITALDQLSQITYGFVQITTQVRECSFILRPFLVPVFDCLQLQKQRIPFLYSY